MTKLGATSTELERNLVKVASTLEPVTHNLDYVPRNFGGKSRYAD